MTTATTSHAGTGMPELPPDAVVLLEARVKAGERHFRVSQVANLISHDPVLTMEFFQFANSAMFAGAPVTDVEAAITRIGADRLISTLTALNNRPRLQDEAVNEAFEQIRFNCRRASIVSMIVAAAARPAIVSAARTAGLFAEVGHMVALLMLGRKYCDTASRYPRKTLAYRLEKEHKIDLNLLLLKYLRSKGLPDRLMLPYDLEREGKLAGDADIRFCVQGAIELIQAYDGEKPYSPNTPLPSRSALRLLSLSAPQQERICKAASEYLSRVAQQETPRTANLLVSSIEEDEEAATHSVPSCPVPLPTYPNAAVAPRSREQLQALFELCELEKSGQVLKEKAVDYLKRSGLFDRVAAVRVRMTSDEAVIEHAALGSGLLSGTTLSTSDPASPFNLFKGEIKGGGTRTGSAQMPFGSAAYAIGPLEIAHGGDRILLYADLASEDSLPVESRRVFRLAVGLLARTLQTLKSKGPAEVEPPPAGGVAFRNL